MNSKEIVKWWEAEGKTKKYIIQIHGEDFTEVEMELDKAGFSTIMRLSELSHKNITFQSIPVVSIHGYDVKGG